MTLIYVDGDACPVKDEIYKVAERYGLKVVVVANSWIRVPGTEAVRLVVVDAGPDAADDFIAREVRPQDIAVTADIPLARRVLDAGAEALHPAGRAFTTDNIGSALAGRAIGEHLRSIGATTSGPPPFGPKDRSLFLQALDAAVVRARKKPDQPGPS